ncbi:hypothetical protein D8674_003175 [Pyrus ussuriensis x Pyrus communis]|uniref:Zinc knuckle CX2CX4HX4C domain-containing protein n=1 Tax=Pyrus ussuriensis x Pyrus communis TaxID=2448454 RepID=A0A5N5FLK8_9ROSA|nr:hypothetical protein D8674_003175 [Pyrus ussuriensis x Pyrus communis]
MDDILQPLRIPLLFEEFWIQLKGLSMCYMTREMGKFIENLVGEYVVAYQSRKTDQFGSILRVRVRLDVNKPLRRSISIKLERKIVDIDIRYEKLPLTCFLYGMMNHVEDQCDRYQGRGCDDKQKPYRRYWKGDDRRKEKKTEVESNREQEHGDMGCRRSGLSTNHGIHCLI